MDDKLTVILPIRFSPNQRKALTTYANSARLSEGEAVRIALTKFLRGKHSQPADRNQTRRTNGRKETATAL
jgi:hypothetical protein